jgi:hypothetical protein
MDRIPLAKRIANSWLPEIGILLLFFLSRLWNNLALPAYIDEGHMIIRARYIEQGRFVFDPLFRHGKWLQPLGMSLLSPDGPESLWLARVASVLLSMFSCAACIALGRMFASRPAGRLAGLFYILPALGFINERSAVSDVWMAAFSALSLAISARLALSRRARLIVPLSLAMVAAVLSKVSAVLLLGVPLAAALILPRGKLARRQALLQAFAAVVLTTIVVAAVFAVAETHKPPGYAEGGNTELPVAKVCKFTPLCDITTSPEGLGLLVTQFLRNILNMEKYATWHWFLVGPPMLVLSLVALVWWVGNPYRRGTAYIWVTVLGRIGLIVAVGNWLPIRNFLIVVTPLAVLAALVVYALWRWPASVPHGRFPNRPALRVAYGALVVLVALAAMFWSAPLDLAFAQHPETVGVPPQDPYECRNRDHYSFAHGYPQVQAILLDWVQANSPGHDVNVVVERERHMVPYWGPRLGDTEQWKDNNDRLRVVMAQWLVEDETIFFVDELPTRPIPDKPYGAKVETVATVPLPSSCGEVSLRVRRLVEEGPELRRSVYEVIFPNPNESEEQYRAIAQYLIEAQAEGAVVVYPPHQFDLLDSRLQWGTALDGVFEIGDEWPLDAQDVEASLEKLASEHSQLHVVLLAEELGDPSHAIETWLNANMQLVSEMWFGPVRLLSYDPPA